MKHLITYSLLFISFSIAAQSNWEGIMEMNSARSFSAEIYTKNGNDMNACIEVNGVAHHGLAAAIVKDASGIVDFILGRDDTDLSVICNDWTILQYGIKYGDEDLVKRLLQSGANPTQESLSGLTPIDLATKLDKPVIVGYLKSLSK